MAHPTTPATETASRFHFPSAVTGAAVKMPCISASQSPTFSLVAP